MTSMLHPDVFGAGVVLGGYFAPIFGNSYVPFHASDPAAKRYQLVTLATSAPPPVALWLQTSKADSLSYTSSAAILKAAHAPLSIQSQVDVPPPAPPPRGGGGGGGRGGGGGGAGGGGSAPPGRRPPGPRAGERRR